MSKLAGRGVFRSVQDGVRSADYLLGCIAVQRTRPLVPELDGTVGGQPDYAVLSGESKDAFKKRDDFLGLRQGAATKSVASHPLPRNEIMANTCRRALS